MSPRCWHIALSHVRHALLSGTTSGNRDRLQVSQNSLVRVVCQASRSTSDTELRRQLHWLPIRQRITYKLAVITYRTRSTGTPVYLTDLIKNYHPSRTLRSADKLLLSVPRMTLALLTKAFSVSVPSVWNSLSYTCVGQRDYTIISWSVGDVSRFCVTALPRESKDLVKIYYCHESSHAYDETFRLRSHRLAQHNVCCLA